jgi:hypothetical protein
MRFYIICTAVYCHLCKIIEKEPHPEILLLGKILFYRFHRKLTVNGDMEQLFQLFSYRQMGRSPHATVA